MSEFFNRELPCPLFDIEQQTLDAAEADRLTVIRKCPTVLELLPSKDQTLLVRRDSFLILDLGLDIIDRVR